MCNSDKATFGSVVCTVYMDGQPYKPCVLCQTGFREIARLIARNSYLALLLNKWMHLIFLLQGATIFFIEKALTMFQEGNDHSNNGIVELASDIHIHPL